MEREFKTNVNKINAENIKDVIAQYQNVPVVGNIKTLIKHFFLNVEVDEEVPTGLVAEFDSSFGSIEKNYGKYLQGNPFKFAFPEFIYEELLNISNKRQKFKKIVAHILLYNSSISDVIIRKICETCEREKIGLTLLEIINLINTK